MPNLPLPEGLGTPDLECVMLDLPPQPVLPMLRPEAVDDLFYGDIPELRYAQGAVAQEVAHVTLLFGIHPSTQYRRHVDAVLGGWELPLVTISHVGHFPSTIEGQNYNVVVAHVKRTPGLLEARARLETLDYSDRFPVYRPHMTLAYIKDDADLDYWVETLNDIYAGTTLVPTGVNYGDD